MWGSPARTPRQEGPGIFIFHTCMVQIASLRPRFVKVEPNLGGQLVLTIVLSVAHRVQVPPEDGLGGEYVLPEKWSWGVKGHPQDGPGPLGWTTNIFRLLTVWDCGAAIAHRNNHEPNLFTTCCHRSLSQATWPSEPPGGSCSPGACSSTSQETYEGRGTSVVCWCGTR